MTAPSDQSARHPIAQQSRLTDFAIGQALRVDDLAVWYVATRVGTDAPLAVAILRRADPLSLARFRLAAQLGARIRHPGVLPVIAAGCDTTYGDYLVTPYRAEQSLEELLAKGALAQADAFQIFRQLATVVDALHLQQIIHRDIHPATILIDHEFNARFSMLGFAACDASRDLVDFDDRDLSSVYYPASQRLGSGDALPSDDFYALGMLLYQLLLGGATPQVPLSPLATFHHDFADIDRVIQRLMAEHIDQRYGTARQAAQALPNVMVKGAIFEKGTVPRQTSATTQGTWNSIAEWLENPLEVVMADDLDSRYLQRSNARADALHRVDAMQNLLERWSQQGIFRRKTFIQLMQPRQILSANFYLYELRVQYEKRSEPKIHQQIHRSGKILPQDAVPDVWDVPVSEPERFVDVPVVTVKIPGSQQVVKCEDCGGLGKLICGQCNGRGMVDRKKKSRNADGSSEETHVEERCRTCGGKRQVKCHGCDGVGKILEAQIFEWERVTKRFFNEDDMTGLPLRTLNDQAQFVCQKDVDIRDPRWRRVRPLRELIDAVLRETDDQVRLLAAELIIKATPVTEVEYEFNNRHHSLSIVGFHNKVRGDWSLYDIGKIVRYSAVTFVVLALVVTIIVRT